MNVAWLLTAALLTNTPEPIVHFDLRPTLKNDMNDPVQVRQAWDLCHAAATLQGVVNRKAPRLYLRYVQAYNMDIDEYWWKKNSEPGAWMAGREVRNITDIAELVQHFRKDIRGVVVYDERVAATSNLASTLAGVRDLIAVRFDPRPDSLYSKLVAGGPKLPVAEKLMAPDGGPLFTGQGTIPGTEVRSTGSAKCDAYLWLKHHYLDNGKVDPCFAGYYIDAYWLTKPLKSIPNHHTLTNHDYFVAKRGWFFDLNIWEDEATVDDPGQKPGSDLRALEALMRSAYQLGGKDRLIHVGGFTPWFAKYTTTGAGSKHGDVATEWQTSQLLSAYNAFVDADACGLGAMANASFHMHFPLKDKYPQKWVTRDELRQRGYLKADGTVDFRDREFIVLYVGDYDACAWIYQALPTLWDHPQRGKVPLMWCLTPVAERRVPMAMDYVRRTASPADYFAAADNGAGYLNPGMLQEPRGMSGLPEALDLWAAHCKPYYQRWDIGITGFVIDGNGPGLNKKGLDCYASFSPRGIVPQKVPATLLHGTMPVIRASYDLNHDPPQSAEVIRDRIRVRTVPFHWFRAILRGPDWYVSLHQKLAEIDPKITWLDAPTFFELYRVYLETTPEAAAGKIESPF